MHRGLSISIAFAGILALFLAATASPQGSSLSESFENASDRVEPSIVRPTDHRIPEPVPQTDACVPHEPIRITEDEGEEGFILDREPVTGNPIYRPGSGVVDGNGTAQDPYVIEEWCIVNPATSQGVGILLRNTTAHVVVRQNFVEGPSGATGLLLFGHTGIFLWNASHARVIDNTVANYDSLFAAGIRVVDSSADVETNTVTRTFDGVFLKNAKGSLVRNNTVANSFFSAILLFQSEGGTVQDNEMGSGGLRIFGAELAHYEHEIDTSNTVNGEPIRYVRDRTGPKVPAPAGQVILVNTTGARVVDLDLIDGSVGIHAAFTEDTLVANNTIAENGGTGVLLSNANGSILENNTIRENGGYGLGVFHSDAVHVRNNTISRHESSPAIRIGYSEARIGNNTITHHRSFWGIRLGHSEAHIVNNTVTHVRYGPGIKAEKSIAEIRDNEIANHGRQGILVEHGQAEIRGNTIADNGNEGVRLLAAQETSIADNTIEGNDGKGIASSRSDDLHVRKNTIEWNGRDGLQLSATHEAHLSDNTIAGNHDNGLFIEASRQVQIENNSLIDNDRSGILLEESTADVQNNTISDNGGFFGFGIALHENSQARIRENEVATNGQGGIDIEGSSHGHVRRNNIHSNGESGLSVTDGEDAIEAVDNWWGAASGPSGGVEDACTDRRAIGDGDAIVIEDGGEVCFDPWLGEPVPGAGAG